MTEAKPKDIDRYEKEGKVAEGVHRFPGPTSGDTVTDRGPDGRFRAAESEEDRFWSQVDTAHPSGCWIWTGRTNGDGYGVFKVKRDGRWTEIRAHRWAFEQVNGPTPLPLDHLCHTTDPTCPGGPCLHRRCVNHHPEHLEEVSTVENTRRAQARKDPQPW